MAQSGRHVHTSRRNLLPPYSVQTCTLKMETRGSSETSAHIYKVTNRHIPEDSTVHSNYCKNIKPHTTVQFSILQLHRHKAKHSAADPMQSFIHL
jgi:hypothetical protein